MSYLLRRRPRRRRRRPRRRRRRRRRPRRRPRRPRRRISELIFIFKDLIHLLVMILVPSSFRDAPIFSGQGVLVPTFSWHRPQNWTRTRTRMSHNMWKKNIFASLLLKQGVILEP